MAGATLIRINLYTYRFCSEIGGRPYSRCAQAYVQTFNGQQSWLFSPRYKETAIELQLVLVVFHTDSAQYVCPRKLHKPGTVPSEFIRIIRSSE